MISNSTKTFGHQNIRISSTLNRVFFLTCLIFSFKSLATTQIKDTLDLGMVYFDIYELPLDSHENILNINNYFNSDSWCSANWRKYQASWSIKDGKLYLYSINVEPCNDKPNYLDLNNLLNSKENQVHAKWYTGSISYRISAIVYYESNKDGKNGIEYEVVIYNIKNGIIISRKIETIMENW